MNARHLEIIQHSLGCDEFGQSKTRLRDENDGCFGYYRNRYVCDSGNSEIDELVALGLMKDHGAQSIAGGMHCYSVTKEGVSVMRKQSPAPPKISRSRKRYLEFLDADCGMTFGEFLKWRWSNRDKFAELGYSK